MSLTQSSLGSFLFLSSSERSLGEDGTCCEGLTGVDWGDKG